MPRIYVIDDRDEGRIVADNIDLELGNMSDKWSAEHKQPLENLHDYLSWLNEEDVAVLVVDERLKEVPLQGSNKTVDYLGHELVDFLRNHRPDFPIFIVAGDVMVEDVKMRFRDVEGIVGRKEFNKSAEKDEKGEKIEESGAEKYVPRMVRAGQRYLRTFETELSFLSEISSKLAQGEKVLEDDMRRAKAIQQKLVISAGISDISTKREWIDQMESLAQELEEFKNEIEQHLED